MPLSFSTANTCVTYGNLAGGAYSVLSPNNQWALHNYYQPTVDLTDNQLREHRITITKKYPALPHKAGRAYAKLKRGDWDNINYVVMPDGRTISIRTVVRPQPDVRLLARVFIEMAKRDMEEKVGD